MARKVFPKARLARKLAAKADRKMKRLEDAVGPDIDRQLGRNVLATATPADYVDSLVTVAELRSERLELQSRRKKNLQLENAYQALWQFYNFTKAERVGVLDRLTEAVNRIDRSEPLSTRPGRMKTPEPVGAILKLMLRYGSETSADRSRLSRDRALLKLALSENVEVDEFFGKIPTLRRTLEMRKGTVRGSKAAPLTDTSPGRGADRTKISPDRAATDSNAAAPPKVRGRRRLAKPGVHVAAIEVASDGTWRVRGAALAFAGPEFKSMSKDGLARALRDCTQILRSPATRGAGQ